MLSRLYKTRTVVKLVGLLGGPFATYAHCFQCQGRPQDHCHPESAVRTVAASGEQNPSFRVKVICRAQSVLVGVLHSPASKAPPCRGSWEDEGGGAVFLRMMHLHDEFPKSSEGKAWNSQKSSMGPELMIPAKLPVGFHRPSCGLPVLSRVLDTKMRVLVKLKAKQDTSHRWIYGVSCTNWRLLQSVYVFNLKSFWPAMQELQGSCM